MTDRAPIVKVGAADRLADGRWVVQGWHFGVVPCSVESYRHPDIGWHTIGGWSLDDLVALSAQEMELARLTTTQSGGGVPPVQP